MNECVIKPDRIRSICMSIVYLILSVISLLLSLVFVSSLKVIPALIAITVLWLVIKQLIRYLTMSTSSRPLVSITNKSIELYLADKTYESIETKDIKKVQLWRNKRYLKLFVESPTVSHPSHFVYVTITAWFNHTLLDKYSNDFINACKLTHHYVEIIDK